MQQTTSLRAYFSIEFNDLIHQSIALEVLYIFVFGLIKIGLSVWPLDGREVMSSSGVTLTSPEFTVK